MINHNIILKKLRDDLCATLPKGDRAFVRTLLTSYILESSTLRTTLTRLTELERLVTSMVFDHQCSRVSQGSILFFARFLRKLEIGDADDSATLAAFHQRQQSLRNPSWSEETLSTAQSWGSLVFGCDVPELVPCFRHGPGSVAEGRLGLDKSSLYFPSTLEAVANELNFDPIKRIRVEPMMTATRITVVPKDWRGGRVIGMEPSWNMVLQQGLKDLLMHRTSHLVPYHDQRRQRARLVDAYELPLATVDLSNASDHVSVALAHDLIPTVWFRLLDATRTPRYVLPDGTVHRTESFALMGNGFCFPVLSCITLVLALTACSLATGIKPSRHALRYFTQNQGVQTFGDDLVIPSLYEDTLKFVFAEAGLVVNHDKSGFRSFRETCGWFHFEGSHPFECCYLRSLEWNDDTYDGLLCLENDLYDRGFPSTAQALAASAPRRVPGVRGLRFAVPHGTGLRSRDYDPTFVTRSRRFHKWSLRVPTRTSEVRKPLLCDQTGWFVSFHGGIPEKEIMRRSKLTSLFIERG